MNDRELWQVRERAPCDCQVLCEVAWLDTVRGRAVFGESADVIDDVAAFNDLVRRGYDQVVIFCPACNRRIYEASLVIGDDDAAG